MLTKVLIKASQTRGRATAPRNRVALATARHPPAAHAASLAALAQRTVDVPRAVGERLRELAPADIAVVNIGVHHRAVADAAAAVAQLRADYDSSGVPATLVWREVAPQVNPER